MTPTPNADDQPSLSGMEIEDFDDRILWLLKVRGHGAILLRSQLVEGKWEFAGVSIFSMTEIQG